MDAFSVSNTLSKGSVYESDSFFKAYQVDAASRIAGEMPAAISNEQIGKGDVLLETYRIESDAIHGGMGSVWRVHHLSWNTDLAMKRPQPRFFAEAGEGRKEEFIAECEHWINLGLHPNIVSCYYVREIGGVPTIFSEWMDGGSLKDAINSGRLYEGTEAEIQERILDIAIQIARGLQYSHENGLIHQDVKPGNILLTKDWDAKVADFGLAKAQSQLTDGEHPASSGYTLQYCPKEQAEGAPAEKWMDVYAWALTVLEMYTGRRLWETGAEAAVQMDRLLSSPQPFASGISMPPAAALCKACVTDRTIRLEDAAEKLEMIYQQAVGVRYPRRLAKSWTHTPDSLNNYALSFLDLGKAEAARASLEQAVRMDPNCMNAVYNDALFAWRHGRINGYEAEKRVLSVQRGSDPEKKQESSPEAEALIKKIQIENTSPFMVENSLYHYSYQSAATQDGKYLLSQHWDDNANAEQFLLYDEGTEQTGALIANWTLPECLCEELAVSPGGSYAATWYSKQRSDVDSMLIVWKLPEAKPFLRVHSDRLSPMYFDTGGSILAGIGEDHALYAWDIGTGTYTCLPQTGFTALYPGHEKETFWAASEGKLSLYRLKDEPACLRTIRMPEGFLPDHLTLSGNGEVLAASVCSAAAMPHRRIVLHASSGSILLDYASTAPVAGPAVLSPDGRWLVMAEEYSQEWVLQTADLSVSPQVFSTILNKTDSFIPLAFTLDGKRLIYNKNHGWICTLDKRWTETISQPVRAAFEISRVQSVRQRETAQETYEKLLSEAHEAFAGHRDAEGFDKLYRAWSVPGYENSEACRQLNQKMAGHGKTVGFRGISRVDLPAEKGEEIHGLFETGTRGLYRGTDGSWTVRKFDHGETVSVFPAECRDAVLLSVDEAGKNVWFANERRGFLGRKTVYLFKIDADTGKKTDETGKLFKSIPDRENVLFPSAAQRFLVKSDKNLFVFDKYSFKPLLAIPIDAPDIIIINDSGEWLIHIEVQNRIMTAWNLFDGNKTAQITDPLLYSSDHVLSGNGKYLLAHPVYPSDEIRLYDTRTLEEEWRIRGCSMLMGGFFDYGARILVFTGEKAMIIQTKTGGILSETDVHGLTIYGSTAISPDGTRLFTPGTKEKWIIDYLYKANR